MVIKLEIVNANASQAKQLIDERKYWDYILFELKSSHIKIYWSLTIISFKTFRELILQWNIHLEV